MLGKGEKNKKPIGTETRSELACTGRGWRWKWRKGEIAKGHRRLPDLHDVFITSNVVVMALGMCTTPQTTDRRKDEEEKPHHQCLQDMGTVAAAPSSKVPVMHIRSRCG